MPKRADDYIPDDIQAAARAAGLSTPLWYIGRANGHEHVERPKTPDQIVREARAAAKGESPPSADESADD